MTQVLGSLLLTREARTEFLAPGFDEVQLHVSGQLCSELADEMLSLLYKNLKRWFYDLNTVLNLFHGRSVLFALTKSYLPFKIQPNRIILRHCGQTIAVSSLSSILSIIFWLRLVQNLHQIASLYFPEQRGSTLSENRMVYISTYLCITHSSPPISTLCLQRGGISSLFAELNLKSTLASNLESFCSTLADKVHLMINETLCSFTVKLRRGWPDA